MFIVCGHHPILKVFHNPPILEDWKSLTSQGEVWLLVFVQHSSVRAPNHYYFLFVVSFRILSFYSYHPRFSALLSTGSDLDVRRRFLWYQLEKRIEVVKSLHGWIISTVARSGGEWWLMVTGEPTTCRPNTETANLFPSRNAFPSLRWYLNLFSECLYKQKINS